MSDINLKATASRVVSEIIDGNKDRAETILSELSRDDLWYVKERLEETYSFAAYLHEIRED